MKIYNELVHNIRLNSCYNVFAYRAAVGNFEGEIQMTEADKNNEGATYLGPGGDYARMLTIDQLEIDNVSFIKIDVENSEYYVLSGAQKTITKNRPVIVLEVMGNFNHYPIDRHKLFLKTFKLLVELGYTVTPISEFDYLALPK
jgi:FkbM family methyltransferase